PAVQSPLAQPAPSAARPSVPSPAAVAQHKPRVRRVNAAPPPSPAPEALDAETRKALEEVRAALALVSAKLNKGRRAATKNLQQVETLDKFFKHKKESEG
ncbi:MAG TPA: hypothetical protein PKD78_14315, partial [Saprospiraceae bacterium]|nr:hypothetical protein [Saprospiraceae bacterium]